MSNPIKHLCGHGRESYYDPDFEQSAVEIAEIQENPCKACEARLSERFSGWSIMRQFMDCREKKINEIVYDFYRCSDGGYKSTARLIELRDVIDSVLRHRENMSVIMEFESKADNQE